jgi:hypothetical protein
MKLSIREYYKKSSYQGTYNKKYKNRKIQNWKIILDHVMERRKLINGVGHER